MPWCLQNSIRAPFNLHGSNLIPAWTSNFIQFYGWSLDPYIEGTEGSIPEQKGRNANLILRQNDAVMSFRHNNDVVT